MRLSAGLYCIVNSSKLIDEGLSIRSYSLGLSGEAARAALVSTPRDKQRRS